MHKLFPYLLLSIYLLLVHHHPVAFFTLSSLYESRPPSPGFISHMHPVLYSPVLILSSLFSYYLFSLCQYFLSKLLTSSYPLSSLHLSILPFLHPSVITILVFLLASTTLFHLLILLTIFSLTILSSLCFILTPSSPFLHSLCACPPPFPFDQCLIIVSQTKLN